MRLIYLHQYFNTRSSAGGTRSFEFARRLVAAGHDVQMITSYRNGDRTGGWFVTVEEGVTVHWLPVRYSNRMSYFRRIIAFLKFATWSAIKAVAIKGDMVFATSTPLTIALPAVFAARRLGVPMVFEVRDLWPELPIAIGAIKSPFLKKFSRWMERWAYRNSEAVIALSPGMKAGVCVAGYPSERVAVIPNSSDSAEFLVDRRIGLKFREDRVWLKNRPLIVYAGTFGKINGADYLVDVAARLADVDPSIRILLIGDGSEEQLIADKASAAGVMGVNFFMEKQVPKSDMPAVFSAATMVCSLFVDMVEMQANSANKFFDALASSRPVFINYGGWQADLIRRSECGIVAWQLAPHQVAELIVDRIHDAEWLERAGTTARELAVRVFDRDQLALQMEKVFDAAIKRQGMRAESVAPGVY